MLAHADADVDPEAAFAAVGATVPRIVLVGDRDHAATALYGALIIKEGAKLPAEGFVAGNFRHGPLELAGPGLTALFFGVRDGDDGEPFRRLAVEVAESGAAALTLGSAETAGCESIVGDLDDGFAGLALGALACQRFTVSLARARGIEPGAFHYGRKVTLL
jgi:glucosamine--fructose-6-phosphate aminotransferase (isomerizing)